MKFLKKNSINIAVGCIYRHPYMNPAILMIFFRKSNKVHATKENDKKVTLLGDFNIGLIKTFLKSRHQIFLI